VLRASLPYGSRKRSGLNEKKKKEVNILRKLQAQKGKFKSKKLRKKTTAKDRY